MPNSRGRHCLLRPRVRPDSGVGLVPEVGGSEREPVALWSVPAARDALGSTGPVDAGRRDGASVFVNEHVRPDGVAVLRLGGELNMAGADVLRSGAADLVERARSRATVDLAKTEFIDSSGLGAS
jgi:hypothetical protein